MKLGTKIIFFVTIFFSVIFLLGGYTLISYYYETSMQREVEAAAEQYQYNKFVVQSALITRGEKWFEGVVSGEHDMSNLASEMNGLVAVYSMDGRPLLSEFPANTEISQLFKDMENGKINYQFGRVTDRTYVLISGIVMQKDTGIYLVTGADVERVSEQQEQVIKKFGVVYAAAIAVEVLLIIVLSTLVTRPIQRLTKATKAIADGNYQDRIKVTSGDEVGQLAKNFNQMSAAVEEKIQELSDSARQKEDFVENFAHELKTPLTSVIGYANRIYQKELSGEEQKQAARYIWNEGMRLEALALKLMDLTVLNHKEFLLQEIQADQLLEELITSEEYLLTEKKVKLTCVAEKAYINVEYDLFSSLIFNLIDNSIKAGADHLQLKGYVDSSKKYVIELEDNGRGIPQGEIKRITEAFYMVDKSRSRKQHGAGIGLNLAEKIAQIHGSSLQFESDGKTGTKVSISLDCKGGVTDEKR